MTAVFIHKRVDETKPAREQLEAITGTDNALSKATSVSGIAGVTEAWIDNNTGKVYVLKQNADGEDEIHELNNPTVNNGNITAEQLEQKSMQMILQQHQLLQNKKLKL